MNDKDHDLLIEVNERGKVVKTLLCNHLRHHFAFNMVMLVSILGLVTSVILLILAK